jgi:hypothetical protein
LAEATTLQPPPEMPQRWTRVLAQGFAICLVAGSAGLFGGGLLLMLVAWLVDPRAVTDLADSYEQLPAELQALLSRGGLTLCGSLFAVPRNLFSLDLAPPRGLAGPPVPGTEMAGAPAGPGLGGTLPGFALRLPAPYRLARCAWERGLPP